MEDDQDPETPVQPTGDQDDSALQALAQEVDDGLAQFAISDAEAAADRKAILESLPADLRAGYPENASAERQFNWLLARTLKALSAKPVTVPVTDTKPPVVTTPEPDFSGLSPVAKIARGYK
jgi:hypothetical protein